MERMRDDLQSLTQVSKAVLMVIEKMKHTLDSLPSET
jgi:hypothetical protein